MKVHIIFSMLAPFVIVSSIQTCIYNYKYSKQCKVRPVFWSSYTEVVDCMSVSVQGFWYSLYT
jgi:hypothetical protein